MPQEIFDQQRPRSAMAKRLDEAFAGCDQWTLAPPSSRRTEASSSRPRDARSSRADDLDVAPWLSASAPSPSAGELDQAA